MTTAFENLADFTVELVSTAPTGRYQRSTLELPDGSAVLMTRFGLPVAGSSGTVAANDGDPMDEHRPHGRDEADR